MKDIREAFKDRRSLYSLKPELPFSEDALIDLIESAVLHTPSAFNCQCQRVVLALGDQHRGLWQDLADILKEKTSPEAFREHTKPKIDGFARAYGTILYYDDTTVSEKLAAQFPTYADNFPVWAEQANGMLQYAIWTLLESEGAGANLQHYNPLIDEKAAQRFNIPSNWKLIAQMPFGLPDGPPDEKTFETLAERFKIFR